MARHTESAFETVIEARLLFGAKEEDRLRHLLGRLSDSLTEIEPSRDVRNLDLGRGCEVSGVLLRLKITYPPAG